MLTEPATIGHNCILPKFRGNGYGKQQIIEILTRLQGKRIKKVVTSTFIHNYSKEPKYGILGRPNRTDNRCTIV